MMYFDYIS
jgi:hypothetical protein